MDNNGKSDKYKGDVHGGAEHAAPYPLSRLAPQIGLIDLAREITQADKVINVRVSAKLQVLVDQIRVLQDEARAVLNAAARDQELHQIPCSFEKKPGKLYHLYRRADASPYFSLLAPAEWGTQPPHQYVDSYTLNGDMSWTASSDGDSKDDTHELVRRLLAFSSTEI